MKGSVFERRDLTWRDRLRDLVKREKPPAALVDPPAIVVERGRPVGYRCEDGSVLRFPEPRLEEPTEEWTRIDDLRWR